MLNKVILVGRLTADPQLRYTQAGTAVCNFCMAVDSGFGDNKRTDFINIVVWGKIGENSAQYLYKGSLAAVDGRLQLRTYEKDGDKRYVSEVVAQSVIFLTPKGKDQGEAPEPELSDYVPRVDDLPF